MDSGGDNHCGLYNDYICNHVNVFHHHHYSIRLPHDFNASHHHFKFHNNHSSVVDCDSNR
jgi:hypothetical protein